MKIFLKIPTLVLSIFILSAPSLRAQDDPITADDKPMPGDPLVVSESWFTIKSVADKVWRIDDRGGDNIYLVEGKDKALLIDTGIGAADLAGCVRSITQLPLMVVNTHGHPDHAGGNYQFSEVYAHPSDFELIKKFNNNKYHKDTIKNVLNENPGLEPFIVKDDGNYKVAKILPVTSGFVFDLGDRKIKVIETPGHTIGSICLFDESNKLLFVGDNNNELVWLFLDGCLPVEAYHQNLKKLRQEASGFETILPGHGKPIDRAFIDEQIICAENILSGECKGEPYHSFAGDALVCYYKRAGIAYDPGNIHAKD